MNEQGMFQAITIEVTENFWRNCLCDDVLVQQLRQCIQHNGWISSSSVGHTVIHART